MAVLDVSNLPSSIDWAHSVAPYIPQLYDLPGQLPVIQHGFRFLWHVYLTTNPLISGFAFSLFLAPVFLIVSETNKNYSQVDRMWGILPTIFNAHWALYGHLAGLPTARVDLLFAVSLVWTVRTVRERCSAWLR